MKQWNRQPANLLLRAIRSSSGLRASVRHVAIANAETTPCVSMPVHESQARTINAAGPGTMASTVE